MASMYGGQAAAGAVGGFKEGFDFINKAEQASQEAKMREERIKKAAMENKLLNVAFDDAMGGPSQEAQELEMLKTQVAEQNKTIQANNSTAMRKDINEAVLPTNGRDRSKMVETLKSRFKTNPDIYKSLGIQNAQTMSILNPRDQKDRTWITNTLGRAGITPEAQGLDPNSPEWQSIIDDAIDGYPAMKADGAIVDLVGLSVATGSSAMANPEFNKRMEDNLTELWGRLDRSADNAEAVLSTEPGEPTPSLEAVEQKEMVSPTTGADIGMQGEKTDTTMAEPIADDIIAKETEVKTERAKARQNIKEVIGGIESGGAYDTPPNKNGYEGKYQFRYRDENDAGTAIAKKLGYTPEEIRNDPKKQEEVMDEYMDMNASSLEKKGHEATPYNLWLAHNQGVGGANAIINGKLTDTVRKNIKNQGVEGKTDEELIANYHAKFAPKMGEEPSAKEAQVSSTITSEISKQGKGQPLNDMRMRKIYALLGRTYPKDVNAPTAKMKNFEFLKEAVGEEKALEAVFGKKGALSRIGKLVKEREGYAPDSREYKEYSKRIEKLGRTGTASKDDADKAREANKLLMSKGQDAWTEEDKQDYEFNLEVIQGYEKTTKEQNTEFEYREAERADEYLIDTADEVIKSLANGDPLKASTQTKLKRAEQIKRKAQPDLARADDKKLEEMNGKRRAINSTAKFINRVHEGDLGDLDKDLIANPISWVQGLFGTAEEGEERDLLEKKATAAARSRTRLGIIQANYIKSMSGTAASDAERQFLTEIMMSGQWDDETMLIEAITEFYDSQYEDLQDYNIAVSPLQEYKAKMVERLVKPSRRETIKEPTGEVTATSPVPAGFKKQHNPETGAYRLVEVK